MTYSWALPVWIYCFRPINLSQHCTVIFQIEFYHLRRWFSLFLICTMLIQGLFWSRESNFVLFSVLKSRSTGSDLRHHLSSSDYFWPVAALRVFQKTRPILNCPIVFIKPSTFWSVCYIAGNDAQVIWKIQQAIKSSRTNPKRWFRN